ncbi:embryonic protein UVS.2-like [Hyla sarda]|uniref:embryonic protein UVS.2-like n=1 Tax=Hyla sarda TaxID=327740 RepID=UPI0024C4090A|nr:embryonic protein UVS.2-like [Hyla sarda]
MTRREAGMKTGLNVSERQGINGDILNLKVIYTLGCQGCLWPKSENGNVLVPYIFVSNYSYDHLNVIRNAMQEFESLTCVRFVPRSEELAYLSIISSDGCLSVVGRLGGAQAVQLEAPGCMFRGVIQHELNHALGFYHEISRPDRDKYIIINYENIAPGFESAFDVVYGAQNLSLEYDYDSVMHFNMYAYAEKSSLPTIIPTPNPNVAIGQRDGLSVLDVEAIKRLYNCTEDVIFSYFSFFFLTDVCSTLLNTPSGTFSSPNYPFNFPNNIRCVWLIRIQNGQISLTFNDINIPDSIACISGYITIYDGPSINSPPILQKLCVSIQLPAIIGSTTQMLIEFVSNNDTTSMRFSASYKTVPCGGTYFSLVDDFTSPGYSSGSYYSNLDCNYTINAPAGYKISLTISFDIEPGLQCRYDTLLVYTSGTINGSKRTLCGINTVSTTSESNVMLLNFQTDAYTQRLGFFAQYYICK